jgi:hypothetical protein
LKTGVEFHFGQAALNQKLNFILVLILPIFLGGVSLKPSISLEMAFAPDFPFLVIDTSFS